MKIYAHIFFFVGIVATAFILRYLYMPSHLFFGPEQGRDFLVVRDMVFNHKLTLIGSKTDAAGIFHGPIYYYLASIPFALSHGDPITVYIFFALIQSLSIILAYRLGLEFTHKKRVGYIAAVLLAVSYQAVVYGRWLSNPPLSIPLSLFFMLFLLKFIRGNSWYLALAAFAYGLLGQAEFINFLLFAVIGIAVLGTHWKSIVKIKPLIVGSSLVVGLVSAFGTYILFDLRHQFLITKSVLTLLTGSGGDHLPIGTSIISAFKVLFEQAALTGGLTGWIAGLVLLVSISAGSYLLLRKQAEHRVVAFWVWLPVVVFAILRHSMLDQLYAGDIAGFIILMALFIDWVWELKSAVGMVAIMVVVFFNIYISFRNLSTNFQVFFQPQQPAVRYADQLSVINWVYGHAVGRPFEFQAYTIPYFWQDAWIYLFDQYGQKHFGYMPTHVDRKLLYVIIQKDGLDPLYQKNWYDNTVITWGRKTNGTTIGEYTVEERVSGT